MLREIHLQTKRHDEMIDITAHVEALLVQENIIDMLDDRKMKIKMMRNE